MSGGEMTKRHTSGSVGTKTTSLDEKKSLSCISPPYGRRLQPDEQWERGKAEELWLRNQLDDVLHAPSSPIRPVHTLQGSETAALTQRKWSIVK